MYYNVPHRFRIKRVMDRAVVQYMLFSPPKLSQESSLWLPKESMTVHDIDETRLHGQR